MSFLRQLVCSGIAWCLAIAPPMATPAATAQLSAADIVAQMLRQNQEQTEKLQHFQALRHYNVEYHGFATTIAGKMDVEVTFDADKGKSFRIISQSGSKLLCDKVLKKAVDSEQEASKDKASNALSPANYRFQLVGTEMLDDRSAYILHVEPIKPSKFLYRGTIWVDAADFAVAKLEVEPAKNPSFWISHTLIHQISKKAAGFWLPEKIRSETKVRVGGTAVLTIDYGAYQVVSTSIHAN
jgi:hypothetical protein